MIGINQIHIAYDIRFHEHVFLFYNFKRIASLSMPSPTSLLTTSLPFLIFLEFIFTQTSLANLSPHAFLSNDHSLGLDSTLLD